MSREERMRTRLRDAFLPIELRVTNESHSHSVPRGSETHFRVLVVSDAFAGKSRVARHRAVQSVLADELTSGLHALAIETMTSVEWLDQGGARGISPACLGGSRADQAD